MERHSKSTTLLEAIKGSLENAGRYNSGDALPPAAILWTDADGEWLPLVKKLRALMPELLTCGPYEPEQKIGPAIWMRCVIDGTLPEINLPEKAIPILYLPKVSRQELRTPETCRDELKPLIELQFRGTVWTQVNGKDWTIEAFLVSENGGLGVDMARDQKTRTAMLGAIEVLATTPIPSLRGHKLEAEDFDRLMIGDTIRDLLLWISNPTQCKEEWEVIAKWLAFKSRCQAEYNLDPESEGDITAAERLGLKQGAWENVWKRYIESPSLYPGIPAALRKAKPQALIYDREPWPDENEKDEASLRTALIGLSAQAPIDARQNILLLDKQHGERRNWIWAQMGLSPLVVALEHLKILAEISSVSQTGSTPDAMAQIYTQELYKADDAVLQAMSLVKSVDDQRAVKEAIRALYLNWLDDSVRAFQSVVEKTPLQNSTGLKDRLVEAEPGQCLLFVDGLRYDVAQRLLGKAREYPLLVSEGYRWAALPSVTSTAKPAITPIADGLIGGQIAADLYPIFEASGKKANADVLREQIVAKGYQVLHGLDAGSPQFEDARGWSECGSFDSLGHKLQGKLANQVNEELELLLDRIRHLLDAGWRSVRVVTDHGWLLMAGGLPSLPIKKYLTECRWSRCAIVKEGAQVDVPSTGWFWDQHQQVAFAPGVSCFIAGSEYAHGGLSLQECVTPDLTFSNSSQNKIVAMSFEIVQWLGLRCRVVIKPVVDGIFVGLRSKPNDPKSKICEPKPVDHEGRAGLLVEDESLAGTAITLVIFDAAGRVLSKYPTIVGGES